LKDDDPRKYRGQMPQEIEVLHQLAIGLEYIHQMKLIHRNIKPEHFLIWVNPVNKEVVMKWSGFESITEANERGTCSMSGIRGTTSWLAPEILKLLDDGEANETKVKQRGTFKSDVFAEGLVFGYFLLKGLHLFGSRMQIKTNIIKNESVNLFSKSDFIARAKLTS
jgi:serine/threonine-protein kinase/endoribonuclease IRE1